MIRVYRWDPHTKAGSCPVLPELPPVGEITGDAVLWVDLENPTPDEEAKVFGEFLSVHPLTLEDVTRPSRRPEEGAHLPKVEEFNDYLFVIVNPLPWEVCEPQPLGPNAESKRKLLAGWKRPQLSALLTHNILVTHHYDSLPCVDAVRKYIGRRTEATRRGPDYLFHLILDEMVDEYAPVVERFADRLDVVEKRLFTRPDPRVLNRLLRLKRQIIFLRKTLVLEREVLARLIRSEFALVQHDELAYYRNVYDHLVRYTELIESAREMVSDLTQTYLASASNRMNEIMKTLTMISTIVLPITLVAGIYGMNFEHMPELKWGIGYPLALGVMACFGLTSVAYFKWKGWI